MGPRLTVKERALARAYRQMIKAARRRTQGPREGAAAPSPRRREISAEHKRAIGQLPCAATLARYGVEASGVHVAHLRFSCAGFGAVNPGLQRKPDDRWCLPLSPVEHRLQHSMGEARYCAELGLDPHSLAAALWASSPDYEAMRRTLIVQVLGEQSDGAGALGDRSAAWPEPR
jgi:hypothetical protein